MTLQQGSWLTVVVVCGISVILLALGGYTGYSIVVGFVGLAAAGKLTKPLSHQVAATNGRGSTSPAA